jgi:disulfide bond formation protein DsbB
MAARSRNKHRDPVDAGAQALPARPTAWSPVGRRLAGDSERPQDPAWALVFGCWIVATASTLGALFFSEVMGLPPCVLCWYQRIFMFPLVLLLPLGLFPFDGKIVRYALPLASCGLLLSVYHLLLVWGFIPEGMRPCTQGVPCSDVQIEWLGFVSIPLLSFLAFVAMCALLFAARTRMSK